MMEAMRRIQNWYHGQCNGDWEHQYGIKIETLDNPGWLIHIDLTGTLLEDRPFYPVKLERDETDWIHAGIKENAKFWLACGPLNLNEALSIFCNWAEAA